MFLELFNFICYFPLIKSSGLRNLNLKKLNRKLKKIPKVFFVVVFSSVNTAILTEGWSQIAHKLNYSSEI